MSVEAQANHSDKVLVYPTAFGDVTLREDRLLTFPNGMLGFADCTVFGLSQMPNTDESPILFLQCVNEPELGFMVAAPEILGLEIKAEDKKQALEEAKMEAENTQFLVILSRYANGDSWYLTANLKAPLLVDSENKIARQHILTSKDYTTQHKI